MDILERSKLCKQSSLLEWYPKIKELPIPQIKTEIFNMGDMLSNWVLGEEAMPEKWWKMMEDAIKWNGGYPAFVRTDQISDKHGWNNTCFIESKEKLRTNVRNLCETNEMLNDFGELDYKALIFREYIPMESSFTAFNGFPVNKELRCFIKNHKVDEIHNYWFEDAIERPSSENWKEELKNLFTFTVEDKDEVLSQLDFVLREFDGYWSVDFAKSKSGIWYLIDMAKGEVSYRGEHQTQWK